MGRQFLSVAGPSMTIWKLALARRSRALLPRIESSKRLSHSSTALLLVMTKLETRCPGGRYPAGRRTRGAGVPG